MPSQIPKPLSPGEETFALHCMAHKLTPLREYKFAEGKKWAFDFAWPETLVAVEVEGGIWIQGRHTRARGFIADCEKYNAAARMGWKVFRYTTEMVTAGVAINDVLSMGL